MNRMDEAMQSIRDVHSSMTDLAKEYGKQIDGLRGRIEQLEAEVESWKSSCERAEKQAVDLRMELEKEKWEFAELWKAHWGEDKFEKEL